MGTIIASIICTLGVAYLYTVRSLRWKRYDAIHKEYRSRYESKTLTPEEAQKVIHVGAYWDMPLLLNYSLAFALFKTYAIPSISKILAGTKELRSKELISKRYADTEILISTWVACPMAGFFDPPAQGSKDEIDPRAMIALARVNWLHSRYKIQNDDYLYTLSLFMLEPPKWAELYGWRRLSSLECYAYYVFWAEIGRKMGIQDIPDSLEKMKAWSIEYEIENMVPAKTNKEVAGYTTDELLHALPEALGFREFGRRISVCLLEERLRIAMMQHVQPWYFHTLTRSALRAVAFVQGWLCLPRRHPGSIVEMEKPEIINGCPARQHPTWWQSKPWYKPQSSGLGYLKDRFAVLCGFYTEMPGPHLKSDGYRLEQMGPTPVEKAGNEEVMRMAADLLGQCHIYHNP